LLNSANDRNQENWRAFGNDTEAGRLMHKLYGNQFKPVISYPAFKTKKTEQSGKWMPNAKNANASDPRMAKFNKKKAMALKVPVQGRRQSNGYAMVDLVPKRRNAADCNSFVEDINMRTNAYRPANLNAYSADAEKERLAEVFTYKGGHALPLELCAMVGPMPSEIRRKQQESLRVEEAKANRRKRLNGGVDPMEREEVAKAPVKSTKDQLFDQVYDEIKERRAHQEAMEETGQGKDTRRSVANEISARVSKLSALDPGRAADVMQELYS